jgi:AbrB family looped-hinge helix DNA binding protein
LNPIPFYYKVRQEVEAVLKARVSSRGQLALPKEVRDQLGLGEGTSVTVRVEGDEVILRKAAAGNWREWEGRFRGSDLLGDLARSRREELTRERKRS